MKPRIYWRYYPKSGRGYWMVSHAPHRSRPLPKLGLDAHAMVIRANAVNDKLRAYRAEYAEERRLRLTT